MLIKEHGPQKIICSRSFTIVRNPYDRLVSLYFHILKRHKNNTLFHDDDPDLFGNPPESSFERFVFNQLEMIMDLAQGTNKIVNRQAHWVMFRSKPLVNRVFKFEDVFFNKKHKLKQFLSIPDSFELTHKNRTKHRPWQDYYNPSIQSLVYKLYEKDFDLFQYSQKVS
jgi:hypothetical protein